jgi:dephospho-CoA kinase
VRGVRNGADLEGELVLFAVNEGLHPSVDTVFFPTRPRLAHVSSSVVKALVTEGGEVSRYCPLEVKEALERRVLGRFQVGVAGGIASGKSLVARRLAEALARRVRACSVSLDAVGHHVLGTAGEPIYREARRRVALRFGAELARADGSMDRRALGGVVFSDPLALRELEAIMHEPMLARFYEQTRAIGAGVIVIEGAILVEAGWSPLVNNNLVLVDASEAVRRERIVRRDGVSAAAAQSRIERQIGSAERRRRLEAAVADARWGRIWAVSNDGTEAALESRIEALAAELAALLGRAPA